MTGRGNKFLLSKFFSFIIISLQGKKKKNFSSLCLAIHYTYVVLQEKKRRELLFPECVRSLDLFSICIGDFNQSHSLKYLYPEGSKFFVSSFNLFPELWAYISSCLLNFSTSMLIKHLKLNTTLNKLEILHPACYLLCLSHLLLASLLVNAQVKNLSIILNSSFCYISLPASQKILLALPSKYIQEDPFFLVIISCTFQTNPHNKKLGDKIVFKTKIWKIRGNYKNWRETNNLRTKKRPK